MTPDELRREANRLRVLADFCARRGEENNRSACLIGAESHDRLADVIEYAEKQMGPPAADWEHDPAKILQTVARIAREGNFRDFSERG